MRLKRGFHRALVRLLSTTFVGVFSVTPLTDYSSFSMPWHKNAHKGPNSQDQSILLEKISAQPGTATTSANTCS